MIWRQISNWLSDKSPCCLVTIKAARGSTPRESGTRMAIGPLGAFTGTIGGGALEWEAIAIACELISQHREGHAHERTFPLGPALGQCCGGSVTLRFEVLAPQDIAWITPIAAAEDAGAFSTTVEEDGRGIGIRTLATPETSAPAKLESHGEARRNVILFGAGHVGRAVVLALAPLPFSIRWVDNRSDIFPSVVPRNVNVETATNPLSIASVEIERGLAMVMTHSHALDYQIVSKLVQNRSIEFIGLIGSDTKRSRFISRLIESKIETQSLTRFVCPIGISGISGKSPAVIAAGIAAQLLMQP